MPETIPVSFHIIQEKFYFVNLKYSLLVVRSVPTLPWVNQAITKRLEKELRGAGTTAAALRAGVPSVVVPFHGDQPFWADLTYKLGVGTKPIPRRKLSAEQLAESIEIALEDGMIRQRASELGDRIRAEDGIAKAVEIIEAAID